MAANQYLGDRETAILIDLLGYPRVVIEFGCNIGRTARAILAARPGIERYVGIDVPFDHEPTLPGQRMETPLRAGSVVNDRRFKLLIQDSRTLSVDDLEPCDAVFIDGDHSYGAVLSDSRLAYSLLRPGGILVWHDYGNPSVEVTQAVAVLYQSGWPVSQVMDTWLTYVRKQ